VGNDAPTPVSSRRFAARSRVVERAPPRLVSRPRRRMATHADTRVSQPLLRERRSSRISRVVRQQVRCAL
jgi:hypothetical protein